MIEARGLTAVTPSGRLLFRDLSLSLSQEKVALVGRNGVGKTTLLEILAGLTRPQAGRVVSPTTPYLVAQQQESAEMSWGELRKQRLIRARQARPEVLLLDEPTQDLDDVGVDWLRNWLSSFRGTLLVASHDPTLLQDFQHFFVISESGCRLFDGSLAELQEELEARHAAHESAYLRRLNRLLVEQEHIEKVARRRARKKRYGRISELDRATPRCTLNAKRDDAQDYHGRDHRRREARLEAVRQWTREGRRALQVELPLVLPVPPAALGDVEVVSLQAVSVDRLFHDLSLNLKQQRLAVTGVNGAGKTTLLKVLLGEHRPDRGRARADLARIGSIAQGGTNWMLDDTLLSLVGKPELLVAHRFPLALAQRPLKTLSPGERVRAALICLYQRSPAVQLLVLDEPTYSLDLLGRKALTQALKAWPGGLVVASHDRVFLQSIGIEQWVELPTC